MVRAIHTAPRQHLCNELFCLVMSKFRMETLLNQDKNGGGAVGGALTYTIRFQKPYRKNSMVTLKLDGYNRLSP